MEHRIITRGEWGAVHGDGVRESAPVATELILHHSVTLAPDDQPPYTDDYAAVRTIERIGASRFGTQYGVPYTFLIPPAGLVFEGHNLRKMGAHTAGFNYTGRGICLIGNYSDRAPTAEQENSLVWLIRHGYGMNWWSVQGLTAGHRDKKATECPGNLAYPRIAAINERVRNVTNPSPAPRPTPAREPWPGWMPSGHFFGLLTGPAKSHGGYYVRERGYVRLIQQWLIFKGYVPGIGDINSRWADGIFERPTFDAVARFQRAKLAKTTTRFGEVWADDWAALVMS